MYASEVEGQKLTFFVSGKLWGRSLVMGDKETGSDWSHILGQCMAGKMKDKKLQILPGKVTTWSAWLEEFPGTTATMIEPTARSFTKEYMKDPADFCMALVHGADSRYWRFDLLAKLGGPLNDHLGEVQVVAYLDEAEKTGHVWNRSVDGRSLEFTKVESKIIDKQTQSEWDLTKGLATNGPLEGKRLKAVQAIVSFTDAWKRFHPETTAWNTE